MGLDVVGTGFGRTGTLSLKHALEQLGFGPCYHMEEVAKRPSHGRAWHRRAFGGELDMDHVFADYRSAVDFPVSAVWREILDANPSAKIVHTVRDPERWWQSAHDTIFQTSAAVPGWFKRLIPHLGRVVDMADRLVWQDLFDGRLADRDHAIAVFERHTADVRAAVPAEHLLVFEVAQGWEPLCAFLDVPVPPTPFPRVNDTVSMKRRIFGLRAAAELTRIAGIGGLALFGRHLLRRRSAQRANGAPAAADSAT